MTDSELKDSIMDIKYGLKHLSEKSDLNNMGKAIKTTISQTEDGRYCLFGISEDGNVKYVLSENTQNYLNEKIKELENNTELKSINAEIKNRYTKIHFNRENHPTVSVEIVYVVESDSNEKFMGFEEAFTSEAPEDPNNIELSNITVRCSGISPIYYDGTVTYMTENPAKLYSNLNSLEDYAEMRSENGDISKEEVMKKDMYPTHYHPQNKDLLREVEAEIENYLDFEFVKQEDSNTDIVRYEIEEHKFEAEVSVRNDFVMN